MHLILLLAWAVDPSYTCLRNGDSFVNSHSRRYKGQKVFGHTIGRFDGSTMITLLHEKINSKDWSRHCLFGDAGFLQLFRVVSSDEMANHRFDVASCQTLNPYHMYTYIPVIVTI